MTVLQWLGVVMVGVSLIPLVIGALLIGGQITQ